MECEKCVRYAKNLNTYSSREFPTDAAHIPRIHPHGPHKIKRFPLNVLCKNMYKVMLCRLCIVQLNELKKSNILVLFLAL